MENGCSHSVNVMIAFGLNGIYMQSPKNRLEKALLHTQQYAHLTRN